MNGDDIRTLRLRKGWSRDQLANSLGVSREKVAAWEDGERVDCPRALSQILGASESDESHRAPRRFAGARWTA